MGRALALLRVSTEAQAGGDRAGLAAQRRECQRIAESFGLEIVETVELAGVSGAKVLAEPRFLALLDRLAAPDVDALVVAAWDRLMRPESFDDYAILGRIHRAGVTLYTPAGPRDLGRDRLLTMLESEIAHYERVRIRERTMRAKVEHRRRGRHVAGYQALPYAVRFDRESGAWSYAPAEAQVVREVFERVLAGERNFTRLAGELGITRTLVHKVLSQPLYSGFRYLAPSGSVARAQGEEQIIFEAPLIERGAWERARAVAASRLPTPKAEGVGTYRGFVLCADCRGPMHVHRERSGGPTYRCRAGRHAQVLVRVVDRACDQAVSERLARPEVIEAALRSCTERTERTTPGDFEAEVKRLREERERVAIAFERGLRSLPDAERRFRELDGALARLARAATPTPPEESVEELALLLAQPFAGWAFLGHEQKRAILAPALGWVRVRRTGRAQAAVEALSLRLPSIPSPPPSSGRRRATWGAWGGGLEVAL